MGKRSGVHRGFGSGSAVSDREARARELMDALQLVAHWRQRIKAYRTTAESCGCPDFQVRGLARREIAACKHMTALRILAAEGVAA